MTDQSKFLDWFRNADLALLHALGVRLVLVPGLRPQIEQRLAAQGIDNAYEDGLRITDARTMPAVREAAAQVSTELQARLSMGLANSPMHGARIRVACGNYITARPIGIVEGVDHGYTGTVRRVDTDAIERALQCESVVVIPPLGFSPTGETFNLHAESVATEVAVELHAHKLLFMDTDATHDPGRRAAIARCIARRYRYRRWGVAALRGRAACVPQWRTTRSLARQHDARRPAPRAVYT